MKNQPKRQHFVPRLHLQHFTSSEPKGHVWTYDAQTGLCRSSVPAETGIEAHFYSVENTDGTMDTRIEEYLARIEGDAAPVYERLSRGLMPKSAKAQENSQYS